MKKLIIFNWKMNLPILSERSEVIKSSTPLFSQKGRGDVEIVICPPFTHLEKVKTLLPSKIKLGAQNCFWENVGAYTGEISPKMLKNLGVEYVIIGHSERRRYLNETDEMINKKVLAALKAGLKVVLCIGENLSIRKRGKKAVQNFIKSQLKKDLNSLSKVKSQKSKVIVAYEPVWAISTENGKSDTPKDALEMIKYIKQILITHYSILNTKVLYGGSVDSKNIESFIKYKEIDGALVGSASIKIKEVKEILKKVYGK